MLPLPPCCGHGRHECSVAGTWMQLPVRLSDGGAVTAVCTVTQVYMMTRSSVLLATSVHMHTPAHTHSHTHCVTTQRCPLPGPRAVVTASLHAKGCQSLVNHDELWLYLAAPLRAHLGTAVCVAAASRA